VATSPIRPRAATASSGRSLGNFVVEEEIGRGGMGVVLLARQKGLERPAVLKKLRRDLMELPELADRFRQEARAAGNVHHQNVVAVYDCFSHRGDLYIAQEYVDGTDLRSALARTGPLPWRIAALLALEAARGLEEIHAQGTVHRDLKPANLLLGRRGEVKIADFGIALPADAAALTLPGVVIGTPPYMPPEQILGERLDARGDLFALGVVLYETLCGAPPYTSSADDTESLLRRMQRERFVRVRQHARGTPRFLARLVRSCLRGKPQRRLPSAAQLRRTLERHLARLSPADCRAELARWLWEHGAFEARANETIVLVAPPATPQRRRRGRLALAAGALLLALLLWGANSGRRAAAPASAPAWLDALLGVPPPPASTPGPGAEKPAAPDPD